MGQSNSPSENYLFLNVMVNFVIVNQKLTGSALHIEKNQTIVIVNFHGSVILPYCIKTKRCMSIMLWVTGRVSEAVERAVLRQLLLAVS